MAPKKAIREFEGRYYLAPGLLPWVRENGVGRYEFNPAAATPDNVRLSEGAYHVRVPVYAPTPPVSDAEAALALAGAKGRVRIEHRLLRSNLSGEELGELGGAWEASASMNNNRDTTWELSLEMEKAPGFDPRLDWVKAVADLVLPDGRARRYPLGVYRFAQEEITHGETRSDWSLTGYSGEMMLLRYEPETAYLARKGQGVLALVRQILTGVFGVPPALIRFPLVDEPLQTDLLFDPASQDAGEEGFWLRVVNELLAAGGFYALKCGADGTWFTLELEALDGRAPDLVYEEGPHGLLSGDLSDSRDMGRFANIVIAISEDPDQEPPISAVARNENDTSPYSVGRYGPVSKKIRRPTFTSKIAAERAAKEELSRSTARYRTVSFGSFPDPRVAPRQVYALEAWVRPKRGAPEKVAEGSFRAMEVGIPLDDPAGEYTHTVSRTERLD